MKHSFCYLWKDQGLFRYVWRQVVSCKSNFSNAQLGKKGKKISIFLLTFYMYNFILFDIKSCFIYSATHRNGSQFKHTYAGWVFFRWPVWGCRKLAELVARLNGKNLPLCWPNSLHVFVHGLLDILKKVNFEYFFKCSYLLYFWC